MKYYKDDHSSRSDMASVKDILFKVPKDPPKITIYAPY